MQYGRLIPLIASVVTLVVLVGVISFGAVHMNRMANQLERLQQIP